MSEKIPRRILIIEDHSDSAESLKMLLEFNDYTVECASDGESGLARVSIFEPDIIICDIGLPGEINGFQVAEQLKRDENTKTISLIALSGYGQNEDVKEAVKAGFDDYIIKPVDFEKLMVLIEKFRRLNNARTA